MPDFKKGDLAVSNDRRLVGSSSFQGLVIRVCRDTQHGQDVWGDIVEILPSHGGVREVGENVGFGNSDISEHCLPYPPPPTPETEKVTTFAAQSPEDTFDPPQLQG